MEMLAFLNLKKSLCSIKAVTLYVLLLLLPNYLNAASYCIEDWACVEEIEENGRISFWLSNQKAFVFTATLVVETRNLRTVNERKNKYVVSQVLEGNQRLKVLELSPVNENRSTRARDSFYWTPGSMFAEHQKNYPYRYPYAKGQYFRIVQGFGGGFSHRGASKYAVDIAMPIGTPVHAARGGTVIDLVEHNHRGGASRRYAKYANFVTVLHDDNTTGEYYHLNKNGVAVELGQKVKAGQKLGYSGNTGFSSLPHLHFAVYRAKTYGNYQSLPFEFVKQG